MLNLFRCFPDTIVKDREHPLSALAAAEEPATVVVKRTPACALTLSSDLGRYSYVWLVDLVRDPRDVVTSVHPGIDGYYTDFGRWERDVLAAEQAERAHSRTIRLRYEDLVGASADVESFLRRRLTLGGGRSFADFEEMTRAAGIAPLSEQALGGIRPLDSRGVGRWRRPEHLHRILEQTSRYPQLLDYLVAYGYEPGHGWLEELQRGVVSAPSPKTW